MTMTIYSCAKTAIPQYNDYLVNDFILHSVNESMTPDEFDMAADLLNQHRYRFELSTAVPGGWHVMITAAAQGNTELLRHFYNKDKALLELGDSCGFTPLLNAVYRSQYGAAETLIDLGADVNVASIRGWKKVIEGEVLRKTPCAMTSLYIAAQELQDVALTRLLIKHKAVSYPPLRGIGKQILNQAQVALAAERVQITSTIRDEISVLPSSLIQMIVEYV